MVSRLFRSALVPLIALSLALGCAPEPSVRDLGSLGGVGKADFTSFDFLLPTIDKSGSLQLIFSARGAFKVELTQPGVASSKRATVRLLIEDGARDEETSSSKTPSIEWEPDSSASISYTLTIKNRSHSRVLDARLVIESTGTVAEPFAAPTARRTFANLLPFAAGAQKVAVAFFDADSTLRISKSGKKTPNGPEDVMLLPGAATGLKKALAEGKLIAVVSNQGGVHWGHTSLADAEAALAKTAELLAEKGARVHYFDLAPEYDDYRKPATGMADHLAQELSDKHGAEIDWDESSMVGDAGWKRNVDTEPDGTPGDDFSSSDRGFAEALEIPFSHPRDSFGWAVLGVRNFHKKAEVDEFLADNPDFGD